MYRFKNVLLQASILLNMMLVFIWVFESQLKELPVWLKFAGRLHPALLHFPIAILLLVPVIELLRNRIRDADVIAAILLSITAFTASLTAICGFFLFHSGDYDNSDDLRWHKITGIAIALVAGSLHWLRTQSKLTYNIILPIGCALLIVAGHLGSSVTHGRNFLTQPLEAGAKKITNINEAVVFRDIIQPVLNEKCVNCHNPNKKKGGLLLTGYQELRKGGENGSAFVPGNADSSTIYQVLLLPYDDDRHMPPEGKPQADADETALLRWWINTGAQQAATVQELKTPDSILTVLNRKYGMGSPLDQLNIAFADFSKIRSLNNPDRGVRQLSKEKPYISVFMANRKHIADKEFDELEPLRQQIISFDLSASVLTTKQAARLGEFPHLQRLHLEHSTITDSALGELTKLKYLSYLNLSNTAVSSKVLSLAGGLTALEKIYLYETGISRNDVEAFRLKHPQLTLGYTPDLAGDSTYRGRLTEPVVTIDSNMFLYHATVSVSYRLKGVDIRYTLDGSEPDSTSSLYQEPLSINRSCTLKIAAMKKGWEPGAVKTYLFEKASQKFRRAVLDVPPDKRYAAKLDTSLIDFIRGSDNHADGNYLGFEGMDLSTLLDLGKVVTTSVIKIGYISNHPAFVLAPTGAELWSADSTGRQLYFLGRVSERESSFNKNPRRGVLVLRYPPKSLRYIRVKVNGTQKTPVWHSSPGSKSWLFVDEIMIE